MVCRSVCQAMKPAKAAEPIEMLFGLRTRVGPGNHVLDGGPKMLRDVAMATNFGTKMAMLCENDSKYAVGYGRIEWSANRLQILSIPCTKGMLPWQPFLSFYVWGAHWRHLANVTGTVCKRRRCGLMSNFFDHLFSLFIFLTYLHPYLPFPLRIGPLSFQAGGHKRRPNLGLSCLSLF